ncbi:hypothetical protein GTS_54860 [Gandjariella thermophila]|uniref:Major facilitator superfamily (MFS) profile domain-containing protein n=1 Tax=Gandjariella thermophila TaxID=1931992 RepID=A0A4D4JIY1_9PSEU|nr:hypothetical protein GTS_54860 [Gandjariella thermophila]
MSPSRTLIVAATSNVGDNISLFAVPWLLTGFTHSAIVVALASAVGRVPGVLARYWAPSLVRDSPLRAMRNSCLIRVAVLGVLSACYVWLPAQEAVLFAFMAAVGITDILFDVALDTHIANGRLPSRELARLNGNVRTIELVSSDFVGRPVGSLLLGVAPVLPFLVNLATSAVSAVLLAMRTATGPRGTVHGDPGAPETVATDAAPAATSDDSARERRISTLRGLIAVTVALTAVYSALLGIQVLYARLVLHAGPTSFAVLLTVSAVGSIAGAKVSPALTNLLGYRATATSMIAIMSAAFVGQGLARSTWTASPAYAAGGFAVACWAVATTTARQLICPAHLRPSFAARAQAAGAAASLLGMVLGGLVVWAVTTAVPERSVLWAAFVVGGLAVAVIGGAAQRPIRAAWSLMKPNSGR